MSAAPTTKAPRRARTQALYPKLRPGPTRDHDAVAGNQRSRLIGAMIEEVAARGYVDATLARLVGLAGVSKRTFHEQFGTKEAYFLATYDVIVANAVRRIGAAYRSEADWHARLRAAFAAYAAEVAEEPNAARLVLIEVLGAGPEALARMHRTRLIFEQLLIVSFGDAPDGVTLTPLIAKGIVCGVERVTRQRLLGDDLSELPAFADDLLAWAVSYRSPAAAALAAPSPYDSGRAPRERAARGENDSARILRCAAQIADAHGYSKLSPERIARAARVTEARFDELFESTEQCFLDAVDRLGLEALVCTARAFQGGEQSAPARHRGALEDMHHAIAALMRHLATRPVVLQIAFVEMFALGTAGLSQHERVLDRFTDELIRALPRSSAPSRLVGDACVGAIWGITHHHVTRGATHLLPALADQLTYIVLAPAVGGQAAVRAILASSAAPVLQGR